MFAPSLILPYSFAVVWLDKAGGSLTTFMTKLEVPLTPDDTPSVCSAADGEQSVIDVPAV